MKKVLSLGLVLALCLSICACSGNSEPTEVVGSTETVETTEAAKSVEAQKADELILSIGEVSLESEAAILVAQTYYDTLTEEQKAEVENLDVLVNAQELLPKKKVEALHNNALELIEQGDYLQASGIVYDNPNFSDYNELVKQCAEGVIPQYIKTNGEQKETGKYFINLVNADGVQISVWYFEESNALQLIYYSTGYGVGDGMMVDYTIGGGEMVFSRSTTNMGQPVNYQEGVITVSEYTGAYTGSLAENSSEELVIAGLKVTSYQTAYDKQTRGYHVTTMGYVNDMLNALFSEIVEAGYKGTMGDIGFVAYISE